MTQLTEAKAAQQSARVAFEDAASRGFPNHNRHELESAVRAANLAIALEGLDGAKTIMTPPAGYDSATLARMGFAEPVAASPADPRYETKTYSDGTTATGIGPLPDHSPAEQAAMFGDLTPETVAFLNSLDAAPYADFGNH